MRATIVGMEHGSITMQRLGVLAPAQLQAALQRFGLGDFVAAAPVPFGLFGQNVFVTSTQGEFVLRGCPHYDWQFPTEQFFAHLIYATTDVPVPFPYLLDPTTDIFGWSYVLMPQMPGLQVADAAVIAQLAPDDHLAIARAMAHTLAELHTITHQHAGMYDYRAGRVQPFAKAYRTIILDEIQAMLAEARMHAGTMPDADAAWVEHLIANYRAAMNEPSANTFVFRDYKEANLVVQRVANTWQVSGVFDLMEAHFGDRERDLARSVGHWVRTVPQCADAFVQVYLEHYSPTPGFWKRQHLYMLHDCLVIWTYLQHHGGVPSEPMGTFQAWAAPAISFWQQFQR